MAPRKGSKSSTPVPSTPTTTVVTPIQSSSNTIKTNPFLKGSSSNKKEVSFASTVQSLWNSYYTQTDSSLKMLDTLQLFLMLTGISQFLYCVIITNYPFNAFLGSFSASVGQFVLTASLRAQVNPENKHVFPSISPESSFAHFVGASLLLHLFVFNYLG